MSAPPVPLASTSQLARAWAPAAPQLGLLLGLALMYAPSLHAMLAGPWSSDEQAHGPIILALALWLIYSNWPAMLAASTPARPSRAGWALLLAGCLLYVLGRVQDLALVDIASLLPVLAGLLLLARGARALRTQWFPLLFMLFMLPLPDALVETLTLPMKTAVSFLVEQLLHAAGYPIARSGVVLQIGQYQLLVADACAGLHTLLTLEALGLLYLNLVRHHAVLRNVLLALLIVPISFVSNVIRVTVLTLITYHLGDAAGQGFLHGFAGMVLFASALMLIIGADSLLRTRVAAPAIAPFQRHPHAVRAAGAVLAPRAALWGAALLMAGAAAAAVLLKPARLLADTAPAIVLATSVPPAFGQWRLDPGAAAVVPSDFTQQAIRQVYSQTLSRTYVNPAGQRVMLAIAYGARQSRQLRAHRQEVCYAAQGFTVDALRRDRLRAGGASVPVTRMVATSGARIEPVTYWFTMGNAVVRSYLDRQMAELRYALTGTIPDGYLVRVSTIGADADAAFALHDAFADQLTRALAPALRARLLGEQD
jgi:exosortase B